MKKIALILSGLLLLILACLFILRYVNSNKNTGKSVNINTYEKSSSGIVQLSDLQQVSEWREENRTGVSAETGLMKSWPETGPKLIWANTELPKGYSSPSFGGNTIFVTGNDGENDILAALDTGGKTKWKTIYGRAWTRSNPESRCTPTVEGNCVYVSSGAGDIACINGESGEIIWSLRASDNFRGTFGDWGIAESLLIDGEKVYFTPGGPETTMIAFSKKTGELIWKSESISDSPAYASPILVDYAGKHIIVNVLQNNIVALDASNGNILWKINHNETLDTKQSLKVWPDAPHTKCVTPLFNDGCIYMTGGYDHGSMLVRMNPEGTGAMVEWTEDVLDVHHGGVVLVDGYIYGSNWISNAKGNWCCLEWSTGKKMWEEDWKCKGSIIAADGMLYLYDEKSGFVGLVKPDPEKFNPVSSFRITLGSGPYWSHPVINNGNLYIRHGEALMVFDIKEN